MRSHTQSVVIELKYEIYHWMNLLHAIDSDCQTRLLNVFGQFAMFWEINKNLILQHMRSVSSAALLSVQCQAERCTAVLPASCLMIWPTKHVGWCTDRAAAGQKTHFYLRGSHRVSFITKQTALIQSNTTQAYFNSTVYPYI